MERWDPAPWGESMADSLKQPPPICVTTSNLVVPRQRVCINRKEPQNWRSAGAPPHAAGALLTPKKAPPPAHMCYHDKVGSSASKDVCINRREPRTGVWNPAPLWWGRGRTAINTLLPHTCYPAEFGCPRSNGTSVNKEIRLKTLTHRVQPFKVTQGHQNLHGSILHL